MGAKITKLLADFQAGNPVAKFDKEGQAGGSRKYGYASYNSVIECLKPLAAKGLSWGHAVAGCRNSEDSYSLHVKTYLSFEDELVSAEIVRPMMPDIQKLGSEITYLKRYQLVALCGMAADEDDDGAAAQAEQAAKPASRAASRPAAEAVPASDTKAILDKALAEIKKCPTARQRQELLALVNTRVKQGKLTGQDYYEFGRSMLGVISDPDEVTTNIQSLFECARDDKLIDDKIFGQLDSLSRQRVTQIEKMKEIGGTLKPGA